MLTAKMMTKPILSLVAAVVCVATVQLVNGDGGSSAEIVYWDTNRLNIFVVRSDGHLETRSRMSGTWGGWINLEGVLTGPVTAVSRGCGLIDVFGRGGDNAMYHKSFSNGAWASSYTRLGGSLKEYKIGVLARAENRMDTFFINKDDDKAYTMSWDGSWSDLVSLEGGCSSGVAATSWASDRMDIFVRGNDNKVYHKGWAGSWPTDWTKKGDQQINGNISALSWGPNRLDVFARSTSDSIVHLYYDSGTWGSWCDLGGGLASSPSAVSTKPGHISVFALGLANAVYIKAWRLDAWSAWHYLGDKPAGMPVAAAADNQIGVVYATSSVVHFFQMLETWENV